MRVVTQDFSKLRKSLRIEPLRGESAEATLSQPRRNWHFCRYAGIGKALENKTDLLCWCLVQPCHIIDQTCHPRAFVTDHAACDRDIQREALFGHTHPACVERLIRLSAETRVFADKLPFDSCAIQVDLPDRGEIPSQKHRAFGGQVRQVQGHIVFYFAICLFLVP